MRLDQMVLGLVLDTPVLLPPRVTDCGTRLSQWLLLARDWVTLSWHCQRDSVTILNGVVDCSRVTSSFCFNWSSLAFLNDSAAAAFTSHRAFMSLTKSGFFE
jgi:hypothetical protein